LKSTRSARSAEWIRSVFFLADVTTDRVNATAQLFESGRLASQVGTVLITLRREVATEVVSLDRFRPH